QVDGGPTGPHTLRVMPAPHAVVGVVRFALRARGLGIELPHLLRGCEPVEAGGGGDAGGERVEARDVRDRERAALLDVERPVLAGGDPAAADGHLPVGGGTREAREEVRVLASTA